ncbi:Rna binding protein [Thalictrum thalictroides]|uniref:Rna binding protein n=1 Tax=Thalictrum thalictroides TaxID=46969 RepID=A0A7J6VZ87_THATH|nr:Rna binding protein [Thalictrum thalictroides]
MRALDENETSVVFEKLFKFTGNNLKNIVEKASHEGPEPEPGRYCFRLQKNRVYYDCRKLDPNGIVVLHQADIGEYLRMEDDL